MNKQFFGVFLFLFTFSHLFSQETNILDVNINNEDLEVEAASLKSWSKNSYTHYSIGALKTYDEQDKGMTAYHASMTQIGYTDLKGISFGVGLKAIQANFIINDEDYSATALGVRLKGVYTFPLKVKTVLTGTYNYAPRSLSFSKDLESYTEYRATIKAEPIDGAWVYLGFRNIEFNFQSVDEKYKFNESAFFGMEIFF